MSVTQSPPQGPARRDGVPRTVPRARTWGHLLTAGQIALVRLRFILVLVGVLVLVGSWPVLRNYWDKLTRPAGTMPGAVSNDTEYWCPMCPGVVSDWPGKCPVCNMALVQRKKGEAVPLPGGVVARMQLSPYRVQLAGIRTTPVEYRALTVDVALAGFVEQPAPGSVDAPERGRLFVQADLFEKDLAVVSAGQAVAAVSEAYPGRTFPGKVRQVGQSFAPDTRTSRVRLEIEDPSQELRPGMFLTARVRAPVTQASWSGQGRDEEMRDRAVVDLTAHALLTPTGMHALGGLGSLTRAAVGQAAWRQGLVPAVPESAVIDTGEKKVVYVETMPDMFDGVEVTLGRRCGDFYPVLRGLEVGQRVVTAGAFLLDAESRLNPSLAAGYFGAGRKIEARGSRIEDRKSQPGSTLDPRSSILEPQDDKTLIARQKVCPVTGEPLGSMGPPFKVVVNGRTVFLCCKGCEKKIRQNPEKYFAKLDGK
jgi:YHS domain-containing protein